VKVPQEKINEIRAATDIVELISEYLTLKKKGRTYFGLCPFHTETAPSFAVDRERQIFHCFGCGEGGNVFSFLMKKENVSFFESLRLLAKRKSIQLVITDKEKREYSERENLYLVNEFAAEFFHKSLISGKEGRTGLDYLQKRGITPDIIKKFRIGYSPDSWDSLLQAARKEMINEELLLSSGLILKREREKGFYDRFRGRIMFTIHNEFGQVIGFGARRLDEDESTPKYINSPETPVYHKGRILYGIYQAKETIRKSDQVILVEGYTDIIALHQSGITNVLATSGTALTNSQVNLISRYTKNTTLVFDADTAGLKAAVRGADILFEGDLNVDIINLDKGNDPDTFIRTKGKEEFLKILSSRTSLIDFLINLHKTEGDLSSYKGKTECIRELIEFVSKVPDRIKRELMTKEISEKLSVNERTLATELDRKTKSFKKRLYGSADKEEKIQDVIALEPLEREIIKIILNDIDTAQSLVSVLSIDDFDNFYAKKIFKKIKDSLKDGISFDPPSIIDLLVDEDSKKLVAELLIEGQDKGGNETQDEKEQNDNKIEEILSLMKSRKIEKQIEELRKEIKEKEAKGEDTKTLLARYNEYVKENIEYKKGGVLWRTL